MFELHQEKAYWIINLCKSINVSHSGYYKWLDRAPSKQEIINEYLAVEIRRVYDGPDFTYGAERFKVAIELGVNNFTCKWNNPPNIRE